MIYYLCDGKRENCKGSESCYKNGGECRHTLDVCHAKNFYQTKHDDAYDHFEEECEIGLLEKRVKTLEDFWKTEFESRINRLNRLNANISSHLTSVSFDPNPYPPDVNSCCNGPYDTRDSKWNFGKCGG